MTFKGIIIQFPNEFIRECPVIILLSFPSDGRRGYWTLRLSVDLEHVGCPNESLQVAHDSLLDPWVRAGSRMALQRRLMRLSKPPRRWKTPTFSQSLKRKITETAPLDLYTDWFYEARKSLIEELLTRIHDGAAEEILITSWESHVGIACWDKHSLSELRAAVTCIGGPCLASICRHLRAGQVGCLIYYYGVFMTITLGKQNTCIYLKITQDKCF